MIELTMNAIIYTTGAKTVGIAQDILVSKVSTDTRTMEKGALFVAIKGEKFDGHEYAKAALDKGACAVVVENAEGLQEDKVLLVKDSRKAYLNIAALHRTKCTAKVVAVTGSVGKTTTKEMIYHVLSADGLTIKTDANLNNEIGLASMLLKIEARHKYAVLELGVDGPNQMLPMALAAAPNIAVITNVGITHLEAFGSKEDIKKEKFTLLEGLPSDGIVILNADDPYLSSNQVRGYKVQYYAIKAMSAEIQARNIDLQNDHTDFELFYKNARYPVHIPVAGIHNVYDALAALSVGEAMGVEPMAGISAIANYTAEGMRQKTVEHNGFTVVEDCYNAGPESMRAALKTLGSMNTTGRRIAVLSDMLELGPESQEAHLEVGRQVVKNKIDILYATGPLSKDYVKEAEELGFEKAHFYEDKMELAADLKKELKPKDIVWVKGSRGMALEKVIEELYKKG